MEKKEVIEFMVFSFLHEKVKQHESGNTSMLLLRVGKS